MGVIKDQSSAIKVTLNSVRSSGTSNGKPYSKITPEKL